MPTALTALCLGLLLPPSASTLPGLTKSLSGTSSSRTAPRSRIEAPFRNLSFDEAREAASTEGKLLFVDFYTTWCAPCKKMDALTWTDLDVQVWLLRNTIPLKIDAEADTRTASIYDVHFFPTLLFATSDGTEVKSLKGFKTADQFLLAARGLATVRKSLADHQAAAEADPLNAKLKITLGDRLVVDDRVREAFEHYLAALSLDSAADPELRAEIFERMGTLQSRFAGMRSSLQPLQAEALARLEESGRASRDAVRDAIDVACMQRISSSQRKTRELFTKLRDGSTGEGIDRDLAKRAAAEALVPFVFDSYLSSRTIAELAGFEPQMELLFEEDLERVEELQSEFGSNEMAAVLLNNARTRAAKRGTDIYGALLALENKERAYAIGNRVIEADPTTRGFLGLIRSSRRVNRPEDALHWAEQGLETLPKDKTTTLKQMKTVLEREIARKAAAPK